MARPARDVDINRLLHGAQQSCAAGAKKLDFAQSFVSTVISV